jgi:hypothetical protein
MVPQIDPLRLLSPNSGQARLLGAVRAQLALPGAPIGATACYISSYYDDNRIHDERTVVSGIGPKGGKARLSPLLRAALHDAAFAFGNDATEGSEDVLLVLPGATLILRANGVATTLTAVVDDPDADPARGVQGMPFPVVPPPVGAWMAARAPADDATVPNPERPTLLILRPDAETWSTMSAHQRLEHHRAIQSDAAVVAWIDGLHVEGAVVFERVGRLGIVSHISDEWNGEPERHPLTLLAL